MRRILIGTLLSVTLATAPLAAAPKAAVKKVGAGPTYGINIFTGLLTGALVGAAGYSIPYAKDRHNQDPNGVIMGAVYGSVATAVLAGVPMAAYEVSSQRPGAGANLFANAFGFGILGGVLGASASTYSYRNKVGTLEETQGEDFLAGAGAGVCGGAVLGLTLGLVEALLPAPADQKRPEGRGIHARIGVMPETAALPAGCLWGARVLEVGF
jgi:hypothetical protein